IGESVAVRIKQHLLPVRSPPDGYICSWMPGQALGLASFCRYHEGVNVSVILPRECNPFTIRRKDRPPFMPARGQLPRVSAVARHAPEVSAVRKHQLRLA